MRIRITAAPPIMGGVRAWYEPLVNTAETFEVSSHGEDHYLTKYPVDPYKDWLLIRKCDCEAVPPKNPQPLTLTNQ